MISHNVLLEFTEKERLYSYFKQDSAMAQTASNSMPAVSGMFGSKSFYWRLMASLFPRPHAMWFLFVTELENKVYRRNTHILHEREEHIQDFTSRTATCEPECVLALHRMFADKSRGGGGILNTSYVQITLSQNLFFLYCGRKWPGTRKDRQSCQKHDSCWAVRIQNTKT